MTSTHPSVQVDADLRELLRESHLDLREDVVAELAALVASGKSAQQIYTTLVNIGGHTSRNPLSQRQ